MTFFSMNEGVINTLFAKDDIDVVNEKRLAKGIAALSARQREILYLYYIKELSHKEIAVILEMNLQSCRNLLSRTLAHLCEFFFFRSSGKGIIFIFLNFVSLF